MESLTVKDSPCPPLPCRCPQPTTLHSAPKCGRTGAGRVVMGNKCETGITEIPLCPCAAPPYLRHQGALASLGLLLTCGCLPGALPGSSAAGSLGGRHSSQVGMWGWESGKGAASSWQTSFLFYDYRTQDFLLLLIIIIEKKKPSPGRGGLLCSHLSGFTPGTGCGILEYLEFWGSGNSENLVAQCIGKKGKFLGDSWVTPADMFLEVGGQIWLRKSWGLAAMVGKKDSFCGCTSVNNSLPWKDGLW